MQEFIGLLATHGPSKGSANSLRVVLAGSQAVFPLDYFLKIFLIVPLLGLLDFGGHAVLKVTDLGGCEVLLLLEVHKELVEGGLLPKLDSQVLVPSLKVGGGLHVASVCGRLTVP